MSKFTPNVDQQKWRPATRMVRSGLERSAFDETSEALYLTSGYVYASAEEAEATFKGDNERYIYSRYANPTLTMFERRLAALEGAEYCVSFASGMAAMFASLACQLKSGDRVVAARALFGSCQYIINEQLPKFGIQTEFVDGGDLGAWAKALSKPAHVVFFESPSNPTLEIIDIKAVSKLAHQAGARVIVDNVFATPVLQSPLELGADIVMYSATKHIDGQGRTMGGAVLTNDATYIEDSLTPFIRHTGPSLSPFNAWVLLKGLETINLRVDQQSRNAAQVAAFLETKSHVSRVLYPGLESHPGYELANRQMSAGGTMLSVDFKAGKKAAFAILNAFKLIDISNNLGDSKTLATHPATTTHQRLSCDERTELGISDGLIRISIGLEDAADICDDFEQALKKV